MPFKLSFFANDTGLNSTTRAIQHYAEYCTLLFTVVVTVVVVFFTVYVLLKNFNRVRKSTFLLCMTAFVVAGCVTSTADLVFQISWLFPWQIRLFELEVLGYFWSVWVEVLITIHRLVIFFFPSRVRQIFTERRTFFFIGLFSSFSIVHYVTVLAYDCQGVFIVSEISWYQWCAIEGVWPAIMNIHVRRWPPYFLGISYILIFIEIKFQIVERIRSYGTGNFFQRFHHRSEIHIAVQMFAVVMVNIFEVTLLADTSHHRSMLANFLGYECFVIKPLVQCFIIMAFNHQLREMAKECLPWYKPKVVLPVYATAVRRITVSIQIQNDVGENKF